MIPYGKQEISWADALRVFWQLRFRSLTQGPRIEEFESKVASYVDVKYAVAVSSATAGLHIAMLALELPANSKVITTPISFVASANSLLYAGHHPEFIDIDRSTLNLNLDLVEQALQKDSTIQAVLPVHFAGFPVDLQQLTENRDRNKIRIIEDAAHAFGARYKTGEKVGSCIFSDMTVFSFHPVKSMTTGEGGIITTNDYEIYKKLLRLRSHGITKLDDQFVNDILSKTSGLTNSWYYEMIELGFNYRLTEIQATLGISQLSKLDKFIENRLLVSRKYRELLADVKQVCPAQIYENDFSANHIFPVRIDFTQTRISRNELMRKLRKLGIGTQVHYIPIPLQPYYQNRGYGMTQLPEAMSYYEQALTLPTYPSLKSGEQERIINLLLNCLSGKE